MLAPSAAARATTRATARARSAGVEPSLILSSPLKRALQTAEMAAEILTYRGRIVRTEALLSEATPEALWEELRNRRGVTGHEIEVSAHQTAIFEIR